MLALQGKRGGDWVTVPGETFPNWHVARQRMGVYARLITDAQWRVVKFLAECPKGR